MHSKFVRVIIDRAIRRELDYAIPESLSARVGVGARVRVPFRDRRALATVVALLEETNAKGIREIEAVIGEGPTLSEPLLELARWIASYYCCPIEAVMRSLLPQVIRRAEVGWKKQQFVEIGSIVTKETMEALRRRAPRQAELLEELTKVNGAVPAAEILRRLSLNVSTLRALAKRGLLKISERAVARDPHAGEQFIPGPELLLNEEQTAAFATIVRAISSAEKAKPILLHGVTGSGKTEIYLQAIRETMKRNRTAIVLLGSAQPALESYHNTLTKKYELATLTQRVDNCQMPLIRVIDLRQEQRSERAPLLSERLRSAISARVAKRDQTILFLNRRGFSTSLLCSKCGKARDCPNCSVALTFHRSMSRLNCHLCGHTAAVPKKCPECGQDALIYVGFGTEKVESTVAQIV